MSGTGSNEIMVTPEQVKEGCLKMSLTKVDHHECSICKHMVHYVIKDEELYFDSSCNCCGGGGPELRGWSDPANWINMQSDEEVKRKLALKFGVEL